MMRICLVRHGQTDWNKKHLIQGRIDTLLNEDGRMQSRLAGQKIKKLNIKWDAVYSSPLKRAYETAQIACDVADINLPIITLDELMERDFGDLEGKVVGKENYELMKNGNVRGLEKLPDLEKRSVNAILNIYKDNKDSNVLLFTHSQIIKGLLSYLIEDFDFTCMLDNSSLNFFEVENDIIKVIEINK